ncbi:hypothetical protein HHI36_018968 [Cryptolaemus montrouzieri]|uniref:Uncharacterized protein n=1 Tax=Cryptolaemus montrouzieri TaxID=559131 RepID=A0ABD2P293_9CUCU
MTFFLPLDRTKYLRTDYQEPNDLETNKRELLLSGKASFYEILREVDVYYGMADGFNYGSYGRYCATRSKHVRKTAGPVELFRIPVTESMKCGFFFNDPLLKPESWFKQKQSFPRSNCEFVKFIEIARRIDKQFSRYWCNGSMKILTGIPSHELPPRFRDDGSQYVSARQTSRVTLAAELYDITKDTEIEW